MSEQAFPPRKCSAMSKRYGRPCRKFAVQGSTTCAVHGAYGGAHGGRAETEVSYAAGRLIAEYLRRAPRHLAEVLQDALHTQDAVLQATRDIVSRGEASAEDVAQMSDAAKTAVAVAIAINRQHLMERIVQAQELAVARAFDGWARALDAGGLTFEQRGAIEDALTAWFIQAEQQAALTGGHR